MRTPPNKCAKHSGHYQALFPSEIGDRDVEFFEINKLAEKALRTTLSGDYSLKWIRLDDREVLMLKAARGDTNPEPVGDFQHRDEYGRGRPGAGGQLIYQNTRTGTDYVKDSIGQFVPRFVQRAITGEDKNFLKSGQGLIPKNDPEYQRKFPISGKKPKPANEPVQHVMGGALSPYISTTKQLADDISNPKGEPFVQEWGRISIDLSYVSPKNIFDVSTLSGQGRWNFRPHGGSAVKKQAIKDVV